MGHRVGYMRVSTREQKFDLQWDALRKAGVEERYCYREVASGSKQARQGLAECLKALQPGNTLVVWRLDRLARSLKHLIEIGEDFQARSIALQVLEGPGAQLDPSTSEGRLLFNLLGSFAEFERELIRERVRAGLVAARERGHKGGRKPKLTPQQQRQAIMMARGGEKITEIARVLGCSRHTIYKAITTSVSLHD